MFFLQDEERVNGHEEGSGEEDEEDEEEDGEDGEEGDEDEDGVDSEVCIFMNFLQLLS